MLEMEEVWNMRAIWKGAVSFGLVSIAVKLYSATEEKTVRFHQVHREDAGRIRYQRVCAVCGQQIPYDDIAKGYDLGGGEIVVLTDEDFTDLPLTTSRAIDVLEFVPARQIDPILFHKAYYLEPEGTSTKPYVLLRDALTDSDKVAIVKVALRQREQLATLRVRDNVLVLNTMLWPDEIRPAVGLEPDEKVTVRDAELDLADMLMDSLGEVRLEDLHDEYRTALETLVSAKLAGTETELPSERPAGGKIIDLMAALEDSVRSARESRETDEGEAVAVTPIRQRREREQAERKPARKTAATGKSVERKPAERKSPGKKAAGGKAGQENSGKKKVAGRKSAS
jgi:DNA end-binding protein Ku